MAANKYVLNASEILLYYCSIFYINHYNYSVLIIFIRVTFVTFPQRIGLGVQTII